MTWHFVDRGFVPGIQACAYVSLFTVTEPGRTGREIWDMGHLDIVHGGGYAEEPWCIFCLTCSHPELTEDHVLTSAYVKVFRTVTRNAVNKSV